MQAPSGFHPDRTLERDDLHPRSPHTVPRVVRRCRRGRPPAARTRWPSPPPTRRGDRRSGTCCSAASTSEASCSTPTTRAAKGRHLDANPRAALVFLWKEFDRQVTVSGRVERVSDESPMPTSLPARGTPRSARGHHRRVGRSPTAPHSITPSPRSTFASKGERCRDPPIGAGTASCRTRWSSGMGGRSGSMTGSGSSGMNDRRPAGGSTGSPPSERRSSSPRSPQHRWRRWAGP